MLKRHQQTDVTSDQHSQSDWSQLEENLQHSSEAGARSHLCMCCDSDPNRSGLPGTAVGPNATCHLTGN